MLSSEDSNLNISDKDVYHNKNTHNRYSYSVELSMSIRNPVHFNETVHQSRDNRRIARIS